LENIHPIGKELGVAEWPFKILYNIPMEVSNKNASPSSLLILFQRRTTFQEFQTLPQLKPSFSHRNFFCKVSTFHTLCEYVGIVRFKFQKSLKLGGVQLDRVL
jgi:hypothetical protein